TFKMIDGAIETADKQRDYYGWETLTNLRGALVDYVSDSPIQSLREVADRYKEPARESKIVLAHAV
ncbi:hypothetical protein KY343_00415, partial [Candidatus Woesearchaeota archaeon]|nr:hypothetical protein [Candidatus Woesearchaeota archaeon]